MKITTTQDHNTTILTIDCKGSTAVKAVGVGVINCEDPILSRPFVAITWASGDTWGYRLPSTPLLLALLGEKSVGQFANAVKREATFATCQ